MKKLAIGVDIGGINTAFGLVDENGDLYAESVISTKKYPYVDDYPAYVRDLCDAMHAMAKSLSFDYELTDTYTAGIVLTGTEIKSIRLGKASLVDTFCYFANGELWVKNMHVAEYFYGSYNNHNARRERKLLLIRRNLEKLMRGTKDPGFTIVPVRLFIK